MDAVKLERADGYASQVLMSILEHEYRHASAPDVPATP